MPYAQETVVVAFDASKEIRKQPLQWALNNIVRPGDCISILAVAPLPSSSWRSWSFSKLRRQCGTVPRFAVWQDAEQQIKQSCQQIIREVHDLRAAKKVRIRVRAVQTDTRDIGAQEASKRAAWMVLDRHLKKDGKFCMQQLDCNIVVVNHHDAEILRLNLQKTAGVSAMPVPRSPTSTDSPLKLGDSFPKVSPSSANQSLLLASPEDAESFTSSERGSSCSSSSDSTTSPNFDYLEERRQNMLTFLEDCSEEESNFEDELGETTVSPSVKDSSKETSETELKEIDACRKSCSNQSSFAVDLKLSEPESKVDGSKPRHQDHNVPSSHHRTSSSISSNASRHLRSTSGKRSSSTPSVITPSDPSERSNLADLIRLSKAEEPTTHANDGSKVPQSTWSNKTAKDTQVESGASSTEKLDRQSTDDTETVSSLRKSMQLSGHLLSSPPPLCSICRCRAPVFGAPPQIFTYKELEVATNGFSQANFLAEGGFGSVHKGVLPDGQAIAVKQHKQASSQGDDEFCSEVEVMSCAQHRNVVTLIGYCMEDGRRLLVYEFICNGSLDSHLYGRDKPLLEWGSRQRIAVGAARGLRYLHEDCRVGCIIHRDIRPNNILLTHDFEPMVGDFGLARWQPDGGLGVETRVIGTFGYLAPEYVESGQITEKADVYSFGVVLLELATGRKAIEYSRPKGQQCLTEWARPLLKDHLFHELADPRLKNCFNEEEMQSMLQAASLCLERDPHLRPRMSQVLHILERNASLERGDIFTASQRYLMQSGIKSSCISPTTSPQLNKD